MSASLSDAEAELWAKGRGERRQRMHADEIHDRLLDLALSMLRKTGLTVSTAHLNFEQLIRIADVPRSSVFRVWDTKEAFFAEVMAKLIEPHSIETEVFDPESIVIGHKVIHENRKLYVRSDGTRDPEATRAVMREAIRRAVGNNFQVVSETSAWRTYGALTATLPSLDEDNRKVVQKALAQEEEYFIARMAGIYRDFMNTLHLKFKDGFTEEIVAGLAASLIGGMIGRALVNPRSASEKILLPGLNGESVEWHPSAVGFMALVDGMVELDDD